MVTLREEGDIGDPSWLHADKHTHWRGGTSPGNQMPEDWGAPLDIIAQTGETLIQPLVVADTLLENAARDLFGGETYNQDTVDWKRRQARKWLRAEALLLGGVCAAPFIYRLAMASSKGKKVVGEDKVLHDLDASSTRAVEVLKAVAPVAAWPAVYMTVDKLETAEYISGDLGDRAQALMGALAVAGIAGKFL